MAGGVTTTGLQEFDRARLALPAVLRGELEGAARRAAARLQGDIKAGASAHGWKLAADVKVEHRPSEQLFRVTVNPHPRRPANLPLWLEYGTRHMVARPIVGPPVLRASASYPGEIDAAVQRAADFTVNR